MRSNERLLSALGRVVDQLAAPVLIVDRAGKIVFANTRGKRMLAERDALFVMDNLLMARDAKVRAALSGILNGANGDRGGAVMLKHGDEQCCIAYIEPLGEDTAAIYVRNLSPGDASEEALNLFRLTARESEVLRAISQIGGVPATARALGLSEGTVKGYLKSIFQKTGATRQAELAKLAFSLEPPFCGN